MIADRHKERELQVEKKESLVQSVLQTQLSVVWCQMRDHLHERHEGAVASAENIES